MALGAGLSSTFGIASETTVGTPVAVTRFIEFDSATLAAKKHTVQGEGLRGGGLVKRASRRAIVAREAGGDVSFDVPTNGFGLVLTHLLGSFSTTATSLGGGLFQQVHNIGPLQGHSFTSQLIKPDTTGTLGPQAFTYNGCKVTGWELSVTQNQTLKAKLTIDALDEATPSNAFAPTTISTASTAGASSFSVVAAIPAGSWVTIGSGQTSEVVLTGTQTGSGPFVTPVATGTGGALSTLTYAHAVGTTVGSATGVNYSAAASLQTASYTAGTQLFNFVEGSLVAGGTTSTVSGLWTNTGGATIANVRSFSLKGSNPLKADRWGMGSAVRSEQLDNNWRNYSGEAEIEYNSRFFYDVYAADVPLAMVWKFSGPNGAVLQFYAPVAVQNDGASPEVSGPDIIIQKLSFDILDDGTNGALQAEIISTDSAL